MNPGKHPWGSGAEPAPAPDRDPAHPRRIRVFISSTFRDMHTEHDLLVKKASCRDKRPLAQDEK